MPEEAIWDKDLTVKENLETLTGKPITCQDDLPKTIVLEAVWTDKHSITFDANGGTFPKDSKTTYVRYFGADEETRDPGVIPTKTLAKFDKWTVDPAGQTEWKPGEKLTEDIRVYAQYEDFDPTSHTSVNTRYPATPTIIGSGSVSNAETVEWTVNVSVVNHFSTLAEADQLDQILD